MRKLKSATLIMLIMILSMVCVTSNTFSWFARPNGNSTTKAMQFNEDAEYKSKSSCEIKSQKICSMSQGYLVPDANLTATTTIQIEGGKVQYFTTEIQNKTAYPTDITLGDMTLSLNDSNLKVTCMTPLKTVNSYTSGVNIAKHFIVPANQTITVEWYIYNSTGSTKSFKVSTLPKILYYA